MMTFFKNRESSKGFLLSFISVFTIGLFLIAGFNFYINPWGSYRNKGRLIINNDRLSKANYLLKQSENSLPEAYILGRSTGMSLRPQVIEQKLGLRSFNLSCYWAQISDLWCWTNFVLNDLEHKPKLLIFALETWHFSVRKNGPLFFRDERRRLLNTPVLSKYLEHKNFLNDPLSRFFDAISIQQLKTSIRVSKLNYAWKNTVIDLQKSEVFDDYGCNKGWTVNGGHSFLGKEIDALYLNGMNDNNMEEREVQLSKKLIPLSQVKEYFPETQLNDQKKKDMEKVYELCQKHNVKVINIILPVHPYFHDLLVRYSNHEKMNHDLLVWLQSMKAKYNVIEDNVNCSHIDLFDGVPGGFFDRYHFDVRNSDKILRKALGSL